MRCQRITGHQPAAGSCAPGLGLGFKLLIKLDTTPSAANQAETDALLLGRGAARTRTAQPRDGPPLDQTPIDLCGWFRLIEGMTGKMKDYGAHCKRRYTIQP